jgi:hypothetical protein
MPVKKNDCKYNLLFKPLAVNLSPQLAGKLDFYTQLLKYSSLHIS